MKLGKTLWKLILLKLAVFFIVLSTFFPDVLERDYDNDTDRAGHVLDRLIQSDAVAPTQHPDEIPSVDSQKTPENGGKL